MASKRSVLFEGMPADLDSPLTKVERAYYHVVQLSRANVKWGKEGGYLLVQEDDPSDPQFVFVTLKLITEPLHASPMIGDIVCNLDSALDNLICSLRIRNGKDCVSNVFFPIRNTPDEFNAALADVKGVGDAAKELIKSFEPYKSGDAVLWPVRQLNRRNKHRTLLTTAVGRQQLLRFGIGNFIFPISLGSSRIVLEAGDKMRLPKPTQIQKPHVAVEVIIDEREIFSEPPVAVEFLLRAVARVREIVKTFA